MWEGRGICFGFVWFSFCFCLFGVFVVFVLFCFLSKKHWILFSYRWCVFSKCTDFSINASKWEWLQVSNPNVWKSVGKHEELEEAVQVEANYPVPVEMWKFSFVWESMAAWLATKPRQQHLCFPVKAQAKIWKSEVPGLWSGSEYSKSEKRIFGICFWEKEGKKYRRWLYRCLLGEDFLAEVQMVWLPWEHIKIRNLAQWIVKQPQ